MFEQQKASNGKRCRRSSSRPHQRTLTKTNFNVMSFIFPLCLIPNDSTHANALKLWTSVHFQRKNMSHQFNDVDIHHQKNHQTAFDKAKCNDIHTHTQEKKNKRHETNRWRREKRNTPKWKENSKMYMKKLEWLEKHAFRLSIQHCPGKNAKLEFRLSFYHYLCISTTKVDSFVNILYYIGRTMTESFTQNSFHQAKPKTKGGRGRQLNNKLRRPKLFFSFATCLFILLYLRTIFSCWLVIFASMNFVLRIGFV